MAGLGLDFTKTAVLAMDFQQSIISHSALAQERDVVRKAKAVLKGARPVHSRLPSESQNILQGEDDRVCSGHHEQPDQLPVKLPYRDIPSEIAEKPLFVLWGLVPFKPSPYCIVVVSPGICHAVLWEIMRDIGIRGKIPSKRKEEHLHARKLEVLHDFPYVRGNEAEVLGNDGQKGKLPQEVVEAIHGRGFNPLPVDGGLLSQAGQEAPILPLQRRGHQAAGVARYRYTHRAARQGDPGIAVCLRAAGKRDSQARPGEC